MARASHWHWPTENGSGCDGGAGHGEDRPAVNTQTTGHHVRGARGLQWRGVVG